MTRHAASRSSLLLGIMWLILAVAPAAAKHRPAAHSPRPSEPRASARDNILLITVDTLRADHLGCYGYKDVRTPTIDALARDGVLFPMAISQVPLTLPSHAAILTGTYPFHNGLQDFTAPPLSNKLRTLAEAFHDHGYATGAVVSSFVLDRSWGLDRGFDYYDDKFNAQSLLEKNPELVERRAGPSVDAAIAWLAGHRSRPVFFWLHLYDPHSPYDPPEPFHSQYHNHEYDGEIAYTDSQLARLIAWLKRSGLYPRTSIVLLSDHGESLGEHGEQEHGFFIYNSTVHVPLIIKPATKLSPKLRPISAPVETIAVAPTVLTMGGIRDPIQQQFDSVGLFADEGSKPPTAAYSETFYPFSSFGWSPLHGLETEKYHYIDAPRSELYSPPNDPAEGHNLEAGQSAVAIVLKDELQKRIREHTPGAAPPSGNSLDESAVAKLRALGYFAYHAPVSQATLQRPLADPKDKLEEFNSILRASDVIEAGHYTQAEALLSQIRQRDPSLYVVPFMQGELALRQQQAPQAAEYFQECLQLAPEFDQAMSGLAGALEAQGKPQDAIQWLQRAIQRNPRNFRAWYEIGWIQERSGDDASATENLQKALAIQPSFAPAWRDLGMLQYGKQQYATAAVNLGKAVALGLNQPTLFNFLGICYSRTNRMPDALRSYRQAIKLSPDYAEAHLNLGFAYEQLHQQQAAKREYAEACRLSERVCQLIRSRRQ
jgi:choline-sulfatase